MPTVLSDQGHIAIPGRSGRRRQNETLDVAKIRHGATSEDMSSAYDGLAAVLNSKASVAELTNIIKKCKKIRDKAIPRLVKGEINNFEKSLVNFVRSVNILYRDGIVSKQKYNAIRSSLSMRFDENGVCRKHINVMKNISVPRLFTYKRLLQRINEIDMGMLYGVRETLCGGLDEESNVNGKYRDLQELLILIFYFYFFNIVHFICTHKYTDISYLH